MMSLFLDTPGHPTSAQQYSNSSKYTIYAHNNQKFGHSLQPPLKKKIIIPGGGHGRRKKLMDFHPYRPMKLLFSPSVRPLRSTVLARAACGRVLHAQNRRNTPWNLLPRPVKTLLFIAV